MAQCFSCVADLSFEDNCQFTLTGGNSRKMWFFHPCEIDTITFGSGYYGGGLITALTLQAPAAYRVVSVKPNTLVVNDNSIAENPGTYTHEVIFNLSGLVAGNDLETVMEKTNEFIHRLVTSNNGIAAIVENSAGGREVFGLNYSFGRVSGLGLTATSERTSGASATDANQAIITLSGVVGNKRAVLADSIVLP